MLHPRLAEWCAKPVVRGGGFVVSECPGVIITGIYLLLGSLFFLRPGLEIDLAFCYT